MPLVRKTSCILFGQQSYGTVKNSGNIGLFTALQCIKIDGGMDFRTILFQFMKLRNGTIYRNIFLLRQLKETLNHHEFLD